MHDTDPPGTSQVQPQTEAWTPRAFLFPHTPLLLPQPRPTLASLLAADDGFEAAEIDRSFALLPSLEAKP